MKAIVTTTVNPPTEALVKFSEKSGWHLYVVGDMKTPHGEYANIRCTYLHPSYQSERYAALSEAIGWNCIQRRNIGFVEAYRDGAEIVATVDDDNIPYDGWGEELLVGREVEVDCYENESGFFDPLSVTSLSRMWHRGYPIQLLASRMRNRFVGRVKMAPMVQADLWDGEPDVDAICRLTNDHPSEKVIGEFPYTCVGLTVFNSQNTFFQRSVVPYYMVVPGADRMDDIWGGIILQKRFGTEPSVVFNGPSVYQRRNYHDIVSDMDREMMGHKDTLGVAVDSSRFDRIYETYKQECLR